MTRLTNEGGRVGPEVREKLAENVKCQQTTGRYLMVRESDDEEKDGQDDETAHLDWPPANGVDCGGRDPVSWYVTGKGKDKIADRCIVGIVVHVLRRGVSDCAQDGGIVKSQAPKGDVDEEPRTRRTQQYLAILSFPKMVEEVQW